MISTVVIERTSEAKLAVEHPDGWDEGRVRGAVTARALDIGGAVPYWSAKTQSVIGAIVIGDDPRETDDDDEPMGEVFDLSGLDEEEE